MKKLINKIHLLALAAVLFVACGDDDITAGKQQEVVTAHFTMSTRAASGMGTAHDPEAELTVERFNCYWVVFTDGSADNNIVAIVKKSLSDVRERDEFTVNLSPGTYKVYGFANIASSYLESLGIEEGRRMPDLSGALFTPDNRYFGNSVSSLLSVEAFQTDFDNHDNLGIPMTSVGGIDVIITNAITVDTSIEVVRMFAKLEFVYVNETGKELTLRSQKVSNLSVNKDDNTGYIPLYNNDLRDFGFLNGKPFKTLGYSYGEGVTLASDPSVRTYKAFYVIESKADELTNSFMLDFEVFETGKTPTSETPEEDYMRYGLTDPNTLTAIRRNDWIRIPVTFSDWQMRLEAFTYPPIGGYPEAEVSQSEGNAFVVRFDGGGEFSIRPFVNKFSDGDNWFGIDNTARISGVPTISIADPDGIFQTAPALNSIGEIRGKMKVASGKSACITISVNVITSMSPLLTKTLTRKIFVTQK